VTTAKVAVEERSAQARSGRGERGRRDGGGADTEAPFYRVGGGAGRLDVREGWARPSGQGGKAQEEWGGGVRADRRPRPSGWAENLSWAKFKK
jgi:hypothetical protein